MSIETMELGQKLRMMLGEVERMRPRDTDVEDLQQSMLACRDLENRIARHVGNITIQVMRSTRSAKEE